jgi:hypothetical protein
VLVLSRAATVLVLVIESALVRVNGLVPTSKLRFQLTLCSFSAIDYEHRFAEHEHEKISDDI